MPELLFFVGEHVGGIEPFQLASVTAFGPAPDFAEDSDPSLTN